MKRFRLILLTFFCFTATSQVFGETPKSNIDLRPLEKVAVQSGGRIKPLSSFSKEVVIYVTGKERFEGKDSITLLFEWLGRKEEWETKPLIPVPLKALRESLGIPGASRVSPKFLSSQQAFSERAERSKTRSDQGETLTLIEKRELELYDKLNLFYASSEGKTWTIVPDPSGPEKKWLSIDMIASDERFKNLSASFTSLLESYRRGDGAGFKKASQDFMQGLGFQNSFALELLYNHLRPFHWAWQLYLLACFALLVGITLSKSNVLLAGKITRVGYVGTIAGFAFHVYGFILRCIIAGRPPVSNMYESIVWVSWAVVFFSVILFLFYRSSYLWLASSAVATLGLILADSFPAVLDPSIAPLVPVLRNNFWLTIHVLTITLSYGAFALALGIGHVSLFAFSFKPENESLHKSLTEFLYRAIQIGVILLASGTILGGVWANYSWGRFWGWDPKETWALIALLGYLAILHARFVGWLGPFGLAVGSVVAFLGILMAWYGVNFVLAAGLHSYGFGGGGLPRVAAFALTDLALVAFLAFLRRKNISLLARS